MRYVLLILCALFLTSASPAGPFSEFPISPSVFLQQNPDVDGSIVVWQEEYIDGEIFDWDIIVADLNGEAGGAFYLGYEGYHDTNPAISGDIVVWQLEEVPTDHDIYFGHVKTRVQMPVSTTTYNETLPDIHGNLVVWQERFEDVSETTDWNIYSADILNPAEPNVQPVNYFIEDQVSPAVYRSDVVFADFFAPEAEAGSFDITVTDTWMRNDPTHSYPAYDTNDEVAPAIDGDFIIYQSDYSGTQTDYDLYAIDRSDPRLNVITVISDLSSSSEEPDISGHFVVWQDNRNGHWDIYGYNLVTKQEFRITDDTADQTRPAISGDLVVWQDTRDGDPQVYGAFLTADVLASCQTPLAGDADGNCRVDLADLSLLAENWLACDLTPSIACGE